MARWLRNNHWAFVFLQSVQQYSKLWKCNKKTMKCSDSFTYVEQYINQSSSKKQSSLPPIDCWTQRWIISVELAYSSYWWGFLCWRGGMGCGNNWTLGWVDGSDSDFYITAKKTENRLAVFVTTAWILATHVNSVVYVSLLGRWKKNLHILFQCIDLEQSEVLETVRSQLIQQLPCQTIQNGALRMKQVWGFLS